VTTTRGKTAALSTHTVPGQTTTVKSTVSASTTVETIPVGGATTTVTSDTACVDDDGDHHPRHGDHHLDIDRECSPSRR